MKINRIVLNNFGSYENLNTFDFSECDNEKRVVVIGGKNGAGKTTLFTAIQVCLYGHFAFGYKTAGKLYLKDVFKLLNSSARLDESRKAFVEIAFTRADHADLKEYVVRRAWSWHNSDVDEQLTVTQNGRALTEAELADFQNYLLHLIPPELLKLYFFDGEQIADYFLKDQEISFRDAIMVLSGNDTFDILYENVRRVMKASEDTRSEAADAYLQARDRHARLLEAVKTLEADAEAYANAIDDATAGLERMQREYKSRGGVSLEAWTALHERLKEEEIRRERINTQRKTFATDVLPFLMIEDLLQQVLPQIQAEKKYGTYLSLKDSLEGEAFAALLADTADKIGATDPKGGETLLSSIRTFLLDARWESFSPLFGLSADEETQAIAAVERISNVEQGYARKIQTRLEQSLEKTRLIRAEIQDSDVEHFEEYVQESARLEEARLSASVNRENTLARLGDLRNQLAEQNTQLGRQKKALEEHLKKKSVASVSGRLLMLLENLQSHIHADLIRKVEADLNLKFRQLLRKKDFFSRIVIDPDFSIHILRDQEVSKDDLIALTQTAKRAPLEEALGPHAVQQLMAQLQVNTIAECNAMVRMRVEPTCNLPVRIDQRQLSSGEKQIFVMALYWAMMHQSKSSLPYIIDTPFARIDTEHRSNIINHFFQELSGQLIVLSTDEEISNRHLQDMENQIASVYMLEYGSDKRTHIHQNQYFEVVK